MILSAIFMSWVHYVLPKDPLYSIYFTPLSYHKPESIFGFTKSKFVKKHLPYCSPHALKKKIYHQKMITLEFQDFSKI